MALMQAGVPIQKQVAGIAMGLIQEDEKVAVLSDILGDEDHLGDMDFKVIGTREGITAIQMDIKIKGLPRAIMEQALEQARKGRLHILKRMDKAISKPESEVGTYAPRMLVLHVDPEQVRDVIGPGGKNIRGLSEATGCSIDIEDDGKVTILGVGAENIARAQSLIEALTELPEVGEIYNGTISSVRDGLGLFIEILPGRDGLLHISELRTPRDSNLNDFFESGQEIRVLCKEVKTERGKQKVSLSLEGVDGTSKARHTY